MYRTSIYCVCLVVGIGFYMDGSCAEVLFNPQDSIKERINETPKGITIEKEAHDTAYCVRSAISDSVFVPILEIPTAGTDNCRLVYQAQMRSAADTIKAYLEMWCYLQGKTFFSKALDQPFSGQHDWQEVSTPFFLKEGEHAEKVVLGVRLEGPGTVWLDQIRLLRNDHSISGQIRTNWQWIPGTLFGVLAGLYGTLVGFLVPKAKGRVGILGIGIFFEGLSLALLITGAVLWGIGKSYATWYGFLLPGIIGVFLFTPLLFTLPKLYEQSEMQKMKSKDALEL